MTARSNGHSHRIAETRGRNEGLGNHYNLSQVIDEWHAIHAIHCLFVAQMFRLTAIWAMAEPSYRKMPMSSSQLTAQLPAALQDFRVAAWFFVVCVPVLLALVACCLGKFIRIVREIHNVREIFTCIYEFYLTRVDAPQEEFHL